MAIVAGQGGTQEVAVVHGQRSGPAPGRRHVGIAGETGEGVARITINGPELPGRP